MTRSFVNLEYSGGVATLTLDRPPLNVMNMEMMEQMNSALLQLMEHPELKVLVVKGKGGVFCGGIDLSEHTRDKAVRLLQVFLRIFETIRMLDVIAVAAVDGAALGGGFELALGCNLVVASESSRFGLPQLGQGVFPPLACVVLPRAAPRRKAMEWILTGDEVSASELASYGLVNRVLSDDEFEEDLGQFVGRLTRNSAAIMSLAKRAQTESYYAAYEEALYKVENLYLRDLVNLKDSREGIAAHLEAREPRWRNA